MIWGEYVIFLKDLEAYCNYRIEGAENFHKNEKIRNFELGII